MVDVGQKAVTERIALAEARVYLPQEVWDLFDGGDLISKKGDIKQVAIIAGIQGAKQTANLIPLCHPLGLSHCSIEIGVDGQEVVVRCTAKINGSTGVEMEALTGASVAALTIYDMCKAASLHIEIRQVRLIAKSGGKRNYSREA